MKIRTRSILPLLPVAALFLGGCGASNEVATRPADPDAPVIGRLETRDLMLVVYSGTNGPMYTVASEDGKAIAENLNEQQLLARFPQLKPLIDEGMAADDARLAEQEGLGSMPGQDQ